MTTRPARSASSWSHTGPGPCSRFAVDAVLAPDQEGVTELILVDNGNSPGVTAALACRMAMEPRLRLISGHGNIGYARGCNLGAREARGRHLLLLNPDCCLRPGAVPRLLAEVAALGDEWMLGCRVRNPDGTDQRGSRRTLLTTGHRACRGIPARQALFPRCFGDIGLANTRPAPPEGTARVPAISGACMMLPATTYRAAGGLDEGYFLHVEDLDLCLRLHRAGIPTYFAPHVEAVHHASTSRTHPAFDRVAQGPRLSPLLRAALRQAPLAARSGAVGCSDLRPFGPPDHADVFPSCRAAR